MNQAPQQRILVVQQGQNALAKMLGMEEFGQNRLELELVTVEKDLPPLIDDGREYLPDPSGFDLVLDYLIHPDLSLDLAEECSKMGIPVVASGKKLKGRGVHMPVTCCGLSRQPELGAYGEMFGSPELSVTIRDNLITEVRVIRGAPCGSTWEAAGQVIGLGADEAPLSFGLETQYCCSADPAGWDPMYEKSPVHFAAEIHRAAMIRAINGVRPGPQ